MSNATKTLALVFVGLLVLTGLVQWMSSPSASEAFQRDVIALDTAAVQTLVIDNPSRDAPVRLTRSDGPWRVQSGEGSAYPASAEAVRRALGTLSTLNVNALVTRQESKHARFQVDSTGTTVTALGRDDQNLARLIVGKPTFTGRQQANTYVRPAGEASVYEVESFLPSQLNKDVEEWRDKSVWSLDRTAITQVDFEYPADSAFTMTKSTAQTGTAWTSTGDTLRTGAVGQVINQITDLRASGFAEGGSPDAFGDALHTLRIHLGSGQQKVIRLKPSAENEATYRATATDYPYVFEVRKSTWDRQVLRSRSALLQQGSE